MLNEVKELVLNILQAENEFAVMAEENVTLGMEQVEHVFEMAKDTLKFEGVCKTVKKYGTPIEDRELLYDASGRVLKGALISSDLVDESDFINSAEFKEVFLMEDGSIKVFYAIHQWLANRKFSLHHKVTRVELEYDLSEFYYDRIIESILEVLRQRQLELDWKKHLMRDRVDRIQGDWSEYNGNNERAAG